MCMNIGGFAGWDVGVKHFSQNRERRKAKDNLSNTTDSR